MGMGPTLSSKNNQGAARLVFMELAIEIARPFALYEIDREMHVELRYCWDYGLLIVVDENPMKYEVTRYGHVLTDRYIKEREKLQSLPVEA